MEFPKSQQSMETTGGLLIVGRKDGHVVAYDVKTGTRQWDYDAKEPVTATPAVFGSFAFVVSLSQFHVIALSHGQLQHQFALDGSTVSSLALTANNIYVSSSTGLYTISSDPSLSSVTLNAN